MGIGAAQSARRWNPALEPEMINEVLDSMTELAKEGMTEAATSWLVIILIYASTFGAAGEP